MTEDNQQNEWFRPPAGILDGNDLDIALGYIERKLTDELHIAENPLYGYAEHPSRVIKELETNYAKSRAHLLGMKSRLMRGDEELAFEIKEVVKQEVIDLYVGDRGCVTGEAHLFFERRKAILALWAVAHEGVNA